MSNGRFLQRGAVRWWTRAMILLLMTGMAVTAKAQSSSPDSVPEPSGWLIPVGVVPMLGESQWSLTGQVQETWDDNILMTPGAQQSDALTAVVFNLADAWTGRRWSWNFQYTPDFSLYAAHSRYNDMAQSLGQGLEFHWTRHTSLRWDLSAHRYPGRNSMPGLSFGLGGMTAGGSVGMQQGAIITGFDQSLGLTHEVSRHSRFSLGVTAGMEHYSQDTAVPAVNFTMLGNSISWGVNAGWSHDLSRHVSVGVQSGLSEFQSSGVAAQSRYATIEPTLTWQVGRRTSVSMGVGPSWMSMASPRWSPGYAANVSLGHEMGRSSVSIFWNRTTQLAQIQGGLQTNSWGASYGYTAGAWNWGASFGESSLAVGAGALPLHSRNVIAYWGYRISPAWIAKTSYSHSAQVMPGMSLAGLSFMRNEWELEIDHIFAGGAHAQAGH
jgi:hypothetical protein